MSKAINSIVKSAINAYNRITPKTFFGVALGTPDKEALKEAIEMALEYNDMTAFEAFMEDGEAMRTAAVKAAQEHDELIAKRQAAFEQEVTEAKAAFDHSLTLKTLAFEREQELKKAEMEHNEKVFVTDSKFTKDFIQTELANARMVHNAEIEAEKARNDAALKIREAQFTQELRTAQELAAQEIAHNKTIADAEVRKAKEESQILYTYDVSTLEKQVKATIGARYEELVKIANSYESREILIAKLEEDKAFFQDFSTARIERSEDVTDALIEKIKTSECKPVTVNVTEAKKAKKIQD